VDSEAANAGIPVGQSAAAITKQSTALPSQPVQTLQPPAQKPSPAAVVVMQQFAAETLTQSKPKQPPQVPPSEQLVQIKGALEIFRSFNAISLAMQKDVEKV
jgi:hypothetical protein